ncbi:MAG: hypothetical protein J0H29_05685 [Sphingobacteriales bacterium]|nr:hypothetical protein [Sphingobacteriales bacterium]OJY92329.1 MAG: hypothetical protein BGP14_14040 [Sphingobacteriales bacterium 44-15]
MQQAPGRYSRKKVLLWAAALFSALPLIGLFSSKSKKQDKTNNETVIMLSEDGSLVEVDKKLLAGPGEKISNEELRRWIKNKPLSDGK